MPEDPKVTVLMPLYNGEHYLREAIESILNQTFSDFEFLIINDGSTDRSVSIIESYKDPRIRLSHNEVNLGLVATLNKGLDLAQGIYIARMDCDDISLSERLERQVAFMDAHPDVGICGTWAKSIDSEGSIVGDLKSPNGKALKKLFWRPSPFIHPTCMIRSDLMKDNRYSPNYEHAEDYELWLRLSKKTIFFNMDEFLLLYRVHATNVSSKRRKEQLFNSYMGFVKFFGDSRISYDDFLALIMVETKINPLRRVYFHWLVCSNTGFDMKSFVRDNLLYLMSWIKACVY